jgi:rhodanese-related sulfurtransferase
VAEATHVELGDISRDSSVVPSGGLALMCGHGERAASAASLLERVGRTDVVVMIGGPGDWARGGRHLTASE